MKFSSIIYYSIFTSMVLFLSCEDPPTQPTENGFLIRILSPIDGAVLLQSEVLFQVKLNNPAGVSVVRFTISETETVTFDLDPAEYIDTVYTTPVNLSIDFPVTFSVEAIAGNEISADSVSITFTTMDNFFFNDSTLSFVDLPTYKVMKFPVTNQLYYNYLLSALSGNQIEVLEDNNLGGFFPSPQGELTELQTFYDPNKGKIKFSDSLGYHIEEGFNIHPATGVTWLGASHFAAYFGWRLPTREEWFEFTAGEDGIIFTVDNLDANEYTVNSVNLANYYGEVKPVGYFNGNNTGVTACTESVVTSAGTFGNIGNVWEFTSTPSENLEFISACGGDYLAVFENPLELAELCTASLINHSSANFSFRCIADISYNGPENDWGGVDGLVSPDECGVCDSDSGNDSFYNGPDDFGGAYDCYGDCNGVAFSDYCGVCSSGNSDHDINSDVDCNSNCFGTALLDDCEDCTGGNTGLEPNYAQDCNNECDGTAFTDACGECVLYGDDNCSLDCAGIGSGTAFFDDCGECFCNGEEAAPGFTCNELENANLDCNNECGGGAFETDCACIGGSTGLETGWCYGCTNSNAENWWCNETLGEQCSTANIDNCLDVCVQGSPPIQMVIPPSELIDDGSCEYWGCADPNAGNFDNTATNCEGAEPGDLSCCDYSIILSFTNIDLNNNTFSINMENIAEIYGFQLDLTGVTIEDAVLGSIVPTDWMLSMNDNSIIAFSLTGSFISIGEGILLDVTATIFGDENICITNQVFANEGGTDAYGVALGDCIVPGS